MAQESQTQGETTERPSATRRTLLVGAGLAGVAGLRRGVRRGRRDGGRDRRRDRRDGRNGRRRRRRRHRRGAGARHDGGDPRRRREDLQGREGRLCQPSQGEFTAFSAECTHKGCSVGSVSDGAIVCPCHDSKFSITDGSVVQPPAEDPLPRRNVTVQGGNITVA
ncbi:Rieske (2Fe-2S) protein [Actinomadura sp. CNU-125]|uniref:Rieske (2Fe-2S) protein n=1 Tax=Actinomadura sp. CNU-125 TaxID=1904961 RepID=UPI0021CCE9B4|nr:Rieske (2Fe-2S) protein [Actinomadura sp. CNU-125]